MSDSSIEQQYVLYAAATSSTLMELLQHWRPWEPGLERREIAVDIPRLAQAIVELVDAGWVEVFLGPLDGESGLVLGPDVPGVVRDPRSWYREDGSAPVVELVLTTAGKGHVQLPPPDRPWMIGQQPESVAE